jgi:hypothetical protein
MHTLEKSKVNQQNINQQRAIKYNCVKKYIRFHAVLVTEPTNINFIFRWDTFTNIIIFDSVTRKKKEGFLILLSDFKKENIQNIIKITTFIG